ncbi:hypothetical protein BG000_008715 [Podila horticola]|nr:hypothetical protein BG000_008715 [Podila horticola]
MFDPETVILPLAPVWHLPRLKSLKLINVMAMMFNYDSLTFMTALENLSLTVWGKKTYAKLVPQLMTHMTRQPLNSTSSEMEEEASSCSASGPTEQQQTHRNGVAPWRLWDSPTALIPLSDLDATGASQSSQQDLTMEPMYMASKLRHFVLHGHWQMSEQDLTAALTDYMPNLTKLELHQVNMGVDTSHMLGFKVFEKVDRIHLNRGRCSRLMDVKTSFVPDAAAKTRVGLVSVPVPNNDSRNQGWRHELRGSRTLGYRVYIIDQQYLTTKEPTIEL